MSTLETGLSVEDVEAREGRNVELGAQAAAGGHGGGGCRHGERGRSRPTLWGVPSGERQRRETGAERHGHSPKRCST